MSDEPGHHLDLAFADGPETAAFVHVEASPEAVFALISDIDLPARFSSEFLGARWLEGASGPAVGARFAGRSRHHAVGEWETESTIVEFDPPRVFAYDVAGFEGGVGARWRFEIEPEAGGCRLTQRMRIGPGRSFINTAIEAMPDKESRILQRRLREHRENMEANLAGVKELLEGRAG